MIAKESFLLPAATIHNILIIQLGDIGDVVWTVPSLLSVQAAYPEAKLSVLVREGCGDLLQAEPYLHKIFSGSASLIKTPHFLYTFCASL